MSTVKLTQLASPKLTCNLRRQHTNTFLNEIKNIDWSKLLLVNDADCVYSKSHGSNTSSPQRNPPTNMPTIGDRSKQNAMSLVFYIYISDKVRIQNYQNKEWIDQEKQGVPWGNGGMSRDNSVNALSQWETTLHCLAYTKWSLGEKYIYVHSIIGLSWWHTQLCWFVMVSVRHHGIVKLYLAFLVAVASVKKYGKKSLINSEILTVQPLTFGNR